MQSALGQPLRAEIDITQLSADEASSLKVGIAPPDAFQAAKLHYSSALSGIRVQLERRPDGRAYLLVTSSSPINEPFLDLLIRAQWSSGQINRNYTLLLDPPNYQEAPISAQVPVQPPSAQAVAPTPSVASAPAMPPAPALQMPTAPVAKIKPSRRPAAEPRQYVVKRGDTLRKIAAASGVEAVSLDQMLTAIYRANQSAFIDGNINLLKAGAVLQIPSAEQAQSIPQQEARRFVVTQSENFNGLAEMSGKAKPQAQLSPGEVTGKVQEPTSNEAQGGIRLKLESKLKLSRAEVATQGEASKAQQIAEQKQVALDEQKIKQLQKNIDELTALSKQAQAVAAAKPQTLAPPAAAASKPTVAVNVPVASHVPASAAKLAAAPSAAAAASAVKAASAPHAASTPAPAPAPAPAAKPAVPKVSKPAPVAQESFLSSLLSNPLLLPAGGALVILLLLLAWLAQRKKASKSQRDVSVLDNRTGMADSFFSATGGERVDTHNDNMSPTFSSSQLETNDVDPVAEADVYLAYGRDLQAEEILKEAVKANPDHLAARLKLLEIYAKRKDVRSFEVGATELFALTQGAGEDWQRVQELGRGLDPANPLYHNTVLPSTPGNPPTAPQNDVPATAPAALDTLTPQTLPSTEMLSGMEVDAAKQTVPEHLDLELHLPVSEPSPAAAPQATAPQLAPTLPKLETPAAAASAKPTTGAAASAKPTTGRSENEDFLMSGGLDFSVPSDFGAPLSTLATANAGKTAAAAVHDNNLEFDLSSISLQDVEPKASAESHDTLPKLEPQFTEFKPPLDLRLELAAESMAMGDTESARNLLNEVIADGDPQLKKRAQDMLDKLGY